MRLNISGAHQWRTISAWIAAVLAVLIAATAVVLTPTPAQAATAVPLGAAQSYAVLGGSEVTNTGLSVISGNLGVSPGTSITGFPPGIVTLGTIHNNDASAIAAHAALGTAYGNAVGQPANAVLGPELSGQTLAPGVYTFTDAAMNSGVLTLNGGPDAVWVFQVPESLTMASGSRVNLIGGAQACNIFWAIGVTATFGSASANVGTFMAQTSITMDDAASIEGRALALNAEVTLINNRITRPTCGAGTGGVLGEVIAGGTGSGGVLGGVIAGGTGSGGVLGGVIAGSTGGPTGGGIGGGPGGIGGGGPGGPGGPGGGGPGGYGDHGEHGGYGGDHGGKGGGNHGGDHGEKGTSNHGGDHGEKGTGNHGDDHGGYGGGNGSGDHDEYGGDHGYNV